jgi:hypothetical protein
VQTMFHTQSNKLNYGFVLFNVLVFRMRWEEIDTEKYNANMHAGVSLLVSSRIVFFEAC